MSEKSSLPNIDLVTLVGQPVRLAEVLHGQPALLTLWATWCEACNAEFESLARLDALARKRGAQVIGVAIGEPRAHVAEFARERKLGYALFVDEAFRFADAIGQKRVPATLVIDRTGKVIFKGGALDERALKALDGVLDRLTARLGEVR